MPKAAGKTKRRSSGRLSPGAARRCHYIIKRAMAIATESPEDAAIKMELVTMRNMLVDWLKNDRYNKKSGAYEDGMDQLPFGTLYGRFAEKLGAKSIVRDIAAVAEKCIVDPHKVARRPGP